MNATRKKNYKYCIVPVCGNTSVKTPAKLFISLPNDEELRVEWQKAMGRKLFVSSKGSRYCCEDHFDLKEDLENYLYLKTMKSGKIRVKPGVVPHIFKCQKDGQNDPTTSNILETNTDESSHSHATPIEEETDDQISSTNTEFITIKEECVNDCETENSTEFRIDSSETFEDFNVEIENIRTENSADGSAIGTIKVFGRNSPLKNFKILTEQEKPKGPKMAAGKKWRESDTIKFVELYEKAECLWNFRHPGYKHRNGRDKAIQRIIEEMNIPDFGVNELKNKIKNIRSTYQQEVNKIRRSRQGLGKDILEEYRTNLAWFPIADRFLSTVINSTKNPQPKTEETEENTSYYQSDTTPSLFSLVETEMTNGEIDNEYTPYTISIDNIKGELEEDDYPTTTHQTKKRKMSHHNSIYDGIEPQKSEESDLHPNQNSFENLQTQDEWYFFGNNIACQLRQLPLEKALLCQRKMFDMLTEARISSITGSNSEEN